MLEKGSIYLLASGLSNQDAIHAIIDSRKQSWMLNLTSNENLTPCQLHQMLHTGDDSVAISVARRKNLSNEVILEILKDPRAILRHAYILRYHHKEQREKLSRQVTSYIISAPWLSTVYASWLLNFKGFTPKQRLMLKYLARKCEDGQYESLSYPELDRQISIAGSLLYKERMSAHANMYGQNKSTQSSPTLNLAVLELDMEDLLGKIGAYYSVNSNTLSGEFVLPIESATSQYGLSFYRTFFQMMEGWEGSLNELVAVTLSVTGQKAKQ